MSKGPLKSTEGITKGNSFHFLNVNIRLLAFLSTFWFNKVFSGFEIQSTIPRSLLINQRFSAFHIAKQSKAVCVNAGKATLCRFHALRASCTRHAGCYTRVSYLFRSINRCEACTAYFPDIPCSRVPCRRILHAFSNLLEYAYAIRVSPRPRLAFSRRRLQNTLAGIPVLDTNGYSRASGRFAWLRTLGVCKLNGRALYCPLTRRGLTRPFTYR